MSEAIDLNWRPATYFRPTRLESYLLSKVKGTALRKQLQALFDAGRHAEVGDLLTGDAVSAADRKALEACHPMFMGGNYLPDAEDSEVEIARISIKSTTYDVTCVYAKPDDGVIRYRVVDEYGGDTLRRPFEATAIAPMTLGEFTDFFLTAWPLIDVLEMNYGDDVDGALGFFSAESEFYPDFHRLCRQMVREHFPKPDVGDECPFCAHFNSPPAADLCKHAVAWMWDGEVMALLNTQAFESAWLDLAELVESTADGSSTQTILEAQARRNPSRRKLIDSASSSLDEVLKALVSARSGDGWSTDGPVGGSGHTIYAEDPSDVDRLTSECHAILKACALRIETATSAGPSLEAHRPQASVHWQFVASGFWAEDVYHSGHVAYYLANPEPGCWVMETRERNAILDDVTDEDVEQGRLNDDQIQAMWGQTLEEAQNAEYRQIVAWSQGVDGDCTAVEMAAVLYRAVCEAGGIEITEPDDNSGLLEV